MMMRGRDYTKFRLSSKYSGSVSGLDALTRLARLGALVTSCLWFSCCEEEEEALASSFPFSFMFLFLFAPFLIVLEREREKKLLSRERNNRAWIVKCGGSGFEFWREKERKESNGVFICRERESKPRFVCI